MNQLIKIIRVPQVLTQTNKEHDYKTLCTSVINLRMSPPSLSIKGISILKTLIPPSPSVTYASYQNPGFAFKIF